MTTTIQQPYSLAEIKQIISTNQYSAEQMLQHLLLIADQQELAIASARQTAHATAMALWEGWFKTGFPTPIFSTTLTGTLNQIDLMVRSMQCGHDCQAHKIKGLLIDAVGKLLASMVGSCTCGNINPDYTAHDDTCTYRLLHECYGVITAILDEVEQVIRVREPIGDNNEQ